MTKNSLMEIILDQNSLASSGPQAEQEKRIAISDLLDENHFALIGHEPAQWRLTLSRRNSRLVFDIKYANHEPALALHLSLSPFRTIVKDYWRICESYYEAIRIESRDRIETIDMARKAIHDEGAALLQERLANKINMDEVTARRLFTLICSLYQFGFSR